MVCKYYAFILILISSGLSCALAENVTGSDSATYARLRLTMEQWANRSEAYAMDSALWYADKGRTLCANNKHWEAYMEMSRSGVNYASLKGDQQQAMNYAESAIDEGIKHLEEGHLLLREMYSSIGSLLGNEGNYKEAVTWQKRSIQGLSIDENSTEKEKVKTINMWEELGQTYATLGDYEQAFLYFEQARKYLDQEMQKRASVFAKAAYNLYFYYGLAKNRKGEAEMARQLLEVAAEIANSHYPDEAWRLIDCSQELGWLEFEVGNYAAAKAYGSRGMKLQQKYLEVFGRTYYAEYDFMLIGESLTNMNKAREAIPWLKKAVEETERLLKPSFGKNFRIGGAYLKYADAFASVHSLDTALAQYQEAIIQYCGDFDERAVEKLPTADQMLAIRMSLFAIRNKARAWEAVFRQNQNPQALIYAFDTYGLMLAMMANMRRQYRGDNAQLFVSEEAKPVYEAAIKVAIEIARNTGEEQYLEKAFKLSEQSKSYLLFLQQNQALAHIELSLPDDTLQKERSLKTNIESTRSRLLTEQQKGTNADEDSLSALKARLFEYNQAYNLFTDNLEKHFPEYFNLKFGRKQVSLPRIKEYVQEGNQVLVEYFVGDSSAFAFVVKEEKLSVVTLASPHQWQGQLDSFLQTISTPTYTLEGITSFSRQATSLFDILIRSALGDSLPSRLLIIPDASLWYVPFSALLTEAVATPNLEDDTYIKRAYRNFPYLLKKTETSYAYSMRTLLAKKPSSGASKTLLAMAPTYEGTLQLQFNREQAEEVAHLFGSTAVLGSKATEGLFRQQAYKYGILHLAMHGQADIEVPMASRLLFYETGDEQEENDGSLYAYEIYGMNFNADVAVLSACETGAGTLAQGEGVLSLARAFRSAGCQSVVFSLWEADGKVTNTLVERLYQQLYEQHRKPYALQKAQKMFLADAIPERVHPYYWASFVLSGQQDALSLSSWKFHWWYWLLLPVLFIICWLIIKKFKKN